MRRTLTTIAAALTIAGGAVLLASNDNSSPGHKPRAPRHSATAIVTRVVDGDTVVLSGLGKARLIGIDTPEVYGHVECYGHQASTFTKRVLTGQRIRYRLGTEPEDRYGRALVYLWLNDGRFVNALLVSRGYATTLTIRPNDDYADSFQRLARRARQDHEGLWRRNSC
jgi:micrococcal nuclease